jgi:hypothetical protein
VVFLDGPCAVRRSTLPPALRRSSYPDPVRTGCHAKLGPARSPFGWLGSAGRRPISSAICLADSISPTVRRKWSGRPLKVAC